MYNYEISKALGRRVEIDYSGVPIESPKKEGMSLWLAFVDGEREPRAVFMPKSINTEFVLPQPPKPGQRWVDDRDGVLHQRNAANTGWVLAEQENVDL